MSAAESVPTVRMAAVAMAMPMNHTTYWTTVMILDLD
jgi:hypothetical protein